jgi:hypothetical protein
VNWTTSGICDEIWEDRGQQVLEQESGQAPDTLTHQHRGLSKRGLGTGHYPAGFAWDTVYIRKKQYSISSSWKNTKGLR